jgi:hypothetical protein
VASIAIPAGRRPLFGRCLVACVSAWLTAVPALAIVLVGVRALSERWFGDVETSSSLGFFSSSAGHPLGLYGLTTVALAVAVTLRAWLWLQCGARVAWWAALAVGALGAAGTQLGEGRGALPLVGLAAYVATVGARPRRQLPAPPRSLLRFAVALWLLLGAVLFVAACRRPRRLRCRSRSATPPRRGSSCGPWAWTSRAPARARRSPRAHCRQGGIRCPRPSSGRS